MTMTGGKSTIRQIAIPGQSLVRSADENRMVTERGGMLPTEKEFIRTLRDPAQYERFQGYQYGLRGRFRSGFSGIARIDYKKGKVLKASEEESKTLPEDQTAFVEKGKGPKAAVVGHFASIRLTLRPAKPWDLHRLAFFEGKQQKDSQKTHVDPNLEIGDKVIGVGDHSGVFEVLKLLDDGMVEVVRKTHATFPKVEFNISDFDIVPRRWLKLVQSHHTRY